MYDDISMKKYSNLPNQSGIYRRQQTDYLAQQYERTNYQSNNKSQCNHQKKITNMKLKIRELECQQKYLMKKNDQILRDLQQENSRQNAQQEESEMWKLKYQRLKAENDRKALRFANLAAGSVLANKNQNILAEHKNKEKLLKSENLVYKTMTQPKLTRQQKQYVKQLQNQNRLRSASLKVLQPPSSKRYSAILPDGLVIHILDNRIKTHRENRSD